MIEINIDSQSTRDALNRLLQGAENPRPAFLDIGERLVESTKQRFDTSSSPDGVAWAPNSEATLKRKKGTKPLIGETRTLSGEINYSYDDLVLEVGSPTEYAAVQQLGAKKGEFGKTKLDMPIPFGDIPARQFLGVSTEDETMMVDVVGDYLRSLV